MELTTFACTLLTANFRRCGSGFSLPTTYHRCNRPSCRPWSVWLHRLSAGLDVIDALTPWERLRLYCTAAISGMAPLDTRANWRPESRGAYDLLDIDGCSRRDDARVPAISRRAGQQWRALPESALRIVTHNAKCIKPEWLPPALEKIFLNTSR